MNEREEKVLEIIFRTICIISLVLAFVCSSIKPLLFYIICYFIYKTIIAIIIFKERMKDIETYKITDIILLLQIIICNIALSLVFLYYLFK